MDALSSGADSLQRRKDSCDRRARLKDSDITNITRYLDDFRLLKPPHANALTLDTSNGSCKNVAERNVECVRTLQAR
jgi:hypothetical protein